MKKFDLLIVQGLSTPDTNIENISTSLENYVREGGSVLISYRTIEYIGSLFGKIVKGAQNCSELPENIVRRSDFCIWDKKRNIQQQHVVTNGAKSNYYVHYAYHVPLIAGEDGIVLAKNSFGYPTLIVGKYGKGKVAFWSGFIGRRKLPDGDERQILLNLCNWLVKKDI